MQTRFIATWSLFFICSAGVASNKVVTAVRTGIIRGTVLDDKHAPVSGALVQAVLLSVPTLGAIKYVETNASGQFVDDNLPWGRYLVSAKKEDALYPDSSWPLYNNNVMTAILLSLKNSEAEIEIHLDQKAALIVGSVVDASTGKPLLTAATKLARVEPPYLFLQSSVQKEGRFRMLVPPSTHVTFSVEAPGYQAWTYSNPAAGQDFLYMRSESKLQFDIRLQPISPK